jgi:hypothetical protein
MATSENLARFRVISLVLFALFLPAIITHGQLPQDLPYDSDPVDFTSAKNIALFLIVPLLMIVLYIAYRQWYRRTRRSDKEHGK